MDLFEGKEGAALRFDTIEAIREAGFKGFKTCAQLARTGFAEVPEDPGVYMVVRDPRAPKAFASRSKGGHFNGKDPTVDLAVLERNWVQGAAVLYIGQAGGGGSSSTLRRRLKRYLSFGAGHPVGHWGGRLIWQLEDTESLLFCWRPAAGADARELEHELIQDFATIFGCRPFANLQV